MGFKASLRHRFQGHCHPSGFTLVELLVVLAIAAILFVVATPNYDSVMAESRLDKERLNLATSLSFARSEAVERGAVVRVCRIDPNNEALACSNTTAGTFEWDAGWRVVLQGSNEVLKESKKADDRVQIDYGCGDYMAFGGTGERAAPSGAAECAFTLSDSQDASLNKQLVINPTGRVRMN